MPVLSDEEGQAAKDELARAIRAYFAVVEPDAYVADWMLITHKLSPELEQSNSSVVGVLQPTGQSFVVANGLLAIAAESMR